VSRRCLKTESGSAEVTLDSIYSTWDDMPVCQL